MHVSMASGQGKKPIAPHECLIAVRCCVTEGNPKPLSPSVLASMRMRMEEEGR